jgi:hypothetical protein
MPRTYKVITKGRRTKAELTDNNKKSQTYSLE